MPGDRASSKPEIEEVGSGARAADAGSRGSPSGVGRGRGSVARRWLPALVLGGLAALIIGAGLIGPKAPADDAAPGTPEGTPAGAIDPTGGPDGTRAVASSPAEVPPATATPVMALRLAGEPPADPFVLLAGRWVNLVTGSVDDPTGCELERPIVLAGGRIVCVTQQVTRPPGSTRATYDLSVVTLGHARPTPAEPWATPPPDAVEDVRPAVPLTSLVGRRDLAFGDPVAVALAPGAESDTLLVAWATLGDDGYRLGLDRYLVADRSAAASGSREILALPFEDARGPTSLADLAVSVSPDGSAALVGVTVARIQPTPGERRLVILRMDAGAVPGDAIGPPEALPSLVTSNAAGPAEVARDHETPCGGGLGEGWATGDAIFLVCPGRPSVFRRVAIHPGSARSFSDREGPPVAAAILDETILMPESGATALWLADNGVAIDRLRGRYYRWSPWARVLWSIDLRAEAGSVATARSVAIVSSGSTGIGSLTPTDTRPAPRPVLAHDVATDRLYLLAPEAAGRGTRIEVVDGATLDSRGSLSTSREPFATMSLSPDGSLLYLATQPRGITGAADQLVAVEVLATDPLAERLFAGRLPPGAWDPAVQLVVR